MDSIKTIQIKQKRLQLEPIKTDSQIKLTAIDSQQKIPNEIHEFEPDNCFDQEEFLYNLRQQMRDVSKLETIEKQKDFDALNNSMFSEPQKPCIYDENDQDFRDYQDQKKIAKEHNIKYLCIDKMNNLEFYKIYDDQYPFLTQRLLILKAYALTQQIFKSLIQKSLFQIFILTVIIMNTVIQAMDDPMLKQNPQWMQQMDLIFLYIYTVEMVIKLIALGFFFNKKSYFKDNWNKLDFLIVVTSWLTLQYSSSKFKSLRALRVLRPLRTVSKIQSLKNMVNSIFSSFIVLKDIIIIMIFYYTLFAITGVQIFGGNLKYNCYDVNTGILQNTLNQDDELIHCISDQNCQEGFICGKFNFNPQTNFLNFDTFMWSFIQVFQSSTLEGWVEIMQYLQQSVNFWTWIYCFFLSFFGAFVIVNLILAVVAIRFLQFQDTEIQQEEDQDHIFEVDFCNKLQLVEKRHFYQLNKVKHNSKIITIINQFKIVQLIRQISEKIKQMFKKKRNSNKVQPLLENIETKFENNNQTQQNPEYLNTVNFNENTDLLKDPKIVKQKSTQIIDIANTKIESEEQLFKLRDDNIQNNGSEINENKDQDIEIIQRDSNTKKRITTGVQDQNLIEQIEQIQGLDLNYAEDKKEEEQVIYQNKNLSEYTGMSLHEAEENLQLKQIYIKELMPFKRYLKINVRLNQKTNLTQQNLILIQKQIDINEQYNQKRNQDFKNFNFLINYVIQDKVFNDEQTFLKREYQDNHKKVLLQQKTQILKDYKQSIQIDILNKQLDQTYHGYYLINFSVNIFTDIDFHKFLTLKKKQKHVVDIAQGFLTTIQQKPQQFQKLRKKMTIEQINYDNFSTMINHEHNHHKNYDNLWKNEDLFEIIKNSILDNYYSGKTQLQVIHPIQDIFKIYNSRNICYEALYKKFQKIVKSSKYIEQDYQIWNQGVLKNIQNSIFKLIISSFFDNFILFIVFFNTVVIILQSYFPDMKIIVTLNDVCSIIFLIEMIFKLIALNPNGYLRDKLNIFDLLIVLTSIVDFVLENQQNLTAFKSLRIIRSMRVLRVSRLLRSLPYMKVIIIVIQQCFINFANILILMVIFIVIFTLLGTQLFGGNMKPEFQNVYRNNWDSQYSSFLITFQVLTLENWNSVQYMALNNTNNVYISILYLYAWIFIGNYVLLNLFLVVLLDGFGGYQHKDDFLKQDQLCVNQEIQDTYKLEELEQQGKKKKKFMINTSPTMLETQVEDQLNYDQCDCKYSFGLFSKSNKFRIKLFEMQQNKYFDNLILKIIILQSIKLLLDTYFDSNKNKDDIHYQNTVYAFEIIDIIFNIIFIIEFLIKSIAKGFLFGFNSYLSDQWSVLDFIIVFFSIIDMMFQNSQIGFIKVIRLLRILRPLRFISHNKSLKILVNSLMLSIMGILNIALVILIIWMIFGILFINFLKGQLGYCGNQINQSNIPYPAYDINIDQCKQMGGKWIIYDINFDNIQNAMISLFVLSSLEGWPDQFFQCVDGGFENTGPIKDNNQWMIYPFISFIIIGSFFCVNLFVAMIGMNFNLTQQKYQSVVLTKEQEQWISMQQLIQKDQIDVSQYQNQKGKIRQFFFNLIKHPFFEIFIMLAIVSNIIVMALENDDIDLQIFTLLELLNNVFTFLFVLEAIIKIFTLGFKNYLHNQWNKFDFVIVIFSIIDIIIIEVLNNEKSVISFIPQLIRIFRIIRVSRLLKLIKNFQSLQKLIVTIIYSLPALLNVTGLLFLIYFIFSILGCFLFKDITYINQDGIVQILNENQVIGVEVYVGFDNFLNSFLTLYRQSTGEDWQKIMFDTTRTSSDGCGPSNCGSPYYVIFFLFFIVLQQYIMLNLFILVLMQNLEENYISQNNPIQQFQEQSDIFKEKWVQLCDQEHIYYINMNKLTNLIINLNNDDKEDIQQSADDEEENLQIQHKLKIEKKKQASLIVMKMNLMSDQNENVFFTEVLFSYLKNQFLTSMIHNHHQEGQMEKIQQIHQRIDNAEKQTLSAIKDLKNKFSYYRQNSGDTQYNRQQTILQNSKQINPMMNMLYIEMCFKSWSKYTQLQQDSNYNSGVEDESYESDHEEEEEDQKQKQNQQIEDEKFNDNDIEIVNKKMRIQSDITFLTNKDLNISNQHSKNSKHSKHSKLSRQQNSFDQSNSQNEYITRTVSQSKIVPENNKSITLDRKTSDQNLLGTK